MSADGLFKQSDGDAAKVKRALRSKRNAVRDEIADHCGLDGGICYCSLCETFRAAQGAQ